MRYERAHVDPSTVPPTVATIPPGGTAYVRRDAVIADPYGDIWIPVATATESGPKYPDAIRVDRLTADHDEILVVARADVDDPKWPALRNWYTVPLSGSHARLYWAAEAPPAEEAPCVSN